MLSEQVSHRAFFGVSLLLFTVSAAATVLWCGSMSVMGEMRMPGGWTMSLAWMRMPGQSWARAAASFVEMWIVMMTAMMLPSVAPLLWRYQLVIGRTGKKRLGYLTALMTIGYFFVWTMLGIAVFPVGAALASFAMHQPGLAPSAHPCWHGRSDRRCTPVHRLESSSPGLLPRDTNARPSSLPKRLYGMETRLASRSAPYPLLCRESETLSPVSVCAARIVR